MREVREVRRVQRMRDHLETHGWPRLNCLLMVALATCAAFLSSVLLLFAFEVRSMPLRYGVSAVAGYLTFVLLIRAWIWWNHRGFSVDSDFEVLNAVAQPGPPGLPDLPDAGIPLELGGDDLLWILIALAIVFAAGAAMFYVIYLAPTLLAEALVDVLIASGIYRGLQRHESTHWTAHVFQRTAIPAVIVVVSAVVAGYALQQIAPEAQSIGGVWASLTK